MNRTVVRTSLLLLVLSACSDPLGVPRDPDAAIQTDQLEYQLIRRGLFFEGRIDFGYTNSSLASIYVQNCGGAYSMVLEQFRDGQWRVAWGNATPDCISPAIEIASGASIMGQLVVNAGTPNCGCGGFTTPEIDGVYRIVVMETYDGVDGNGFASGELVAPELRTSNRFVITR